MPLLALSIEELTVNSGNTFYTKIFNNNSTDVNGILILAACKDEKLVEIIVCNPTDFRPIYNTFVDNIELGITLSPRHTVKAYVWMDFNTLYQLLNVMEL